MAQMRFRGSNRPTSLHETSRDRSPAGQAGDAPLALPAPPDIAWSLESYPYPDPQLTAAEDAAAEPVEPATPAAVPSRQRRRTRRTPGGDQ